MESLERWQQTLGLGNQFILAQLCEGTDEHKLCHCVSFTKEHVKAGLQLYFFKKKKKVTYL